MKPAKKRVLFVCMGNICRSPAGEGVFLKHVQDAGLSDVISVDSAGTIGYHAGASADPRMIRAAHARGYRLTSKARRITANDLVDFNLIIAMDRDNLAGIQALAADNPTCAEIKLLSEFLPDTFPNDVPDPYYGGDAGFERVLDMIEHACDPILRHLRGKESQS